MLYLIGGSPRCGKTTVAKHLAQATGCSRVPADYLTTAFMNYVPETEWQSRFPNEGIRGDARFATFTATQIIANYRTKAEHTWPGIRDFIAYALYDQHDMAIEGYQIEPRFAHEVIAAYPQFTIKAAFLCRAQIDQIRADLKKSTDPTDWLVRETKEDITFTRVAELVCEYSDYFRVEAARYQLPVFEMDNTFRTRVDAVVAYLLKA